MTGRDTPDRPDEAMIDDLNSEDGFPTDYELPPNARFDPFTGEPIDPLNTFTMHPVAVAERTRDHLRTHKTFVEDRPWLYSPSPQLRFDEEAKIAFLEEYARSECMADAAAVAGVSEFTVLEHIKYDPVFSALYVEAKAAYRDSIKREVHRRGVQGVVRAKWDNGRIVGHEVVYSDRLLELEAKRIEPGYRENNGVNVQVNQTNNNQAAVQNLDLSTLNAAELKQFRALATKMVRAQTAAPAPTSALAAPPPKAEGE